MNTLLKAFRKPLLFTAFACAIITVSYFANAQDSKQNADTRTKQTTTKKIQRPVLFTGEVQALDSQSILVPSTNVNPVPIRYFVPEGKSVKTGDVVLRIDSQADGQAEQVELQLVQTRENFLKEVADLEVKKIEQTSYWCKQKRQ